MPELTDADRAAIARAREVLDGHSQAGQFGMAERIGQLEHHLAEVLRRLERHGSS